MSIIMFPRMVSIPVACWRIIEWGVNSYTKCARCFRSYGNYSKSIYPFHQSKPLIGKSLIWLKEWLEGMIYEYIVPILGMSYGVYGLFFSRLGI